jgi:Leucine-rich repeat (LRR) protein
MKTRILKTGATAVVICLVLSFAANVLFASNPADNSEKIIRKAIARQLKKDPNKLTDDDFKKVATLSRSSSTPVPVEKQLNRDPNKLPNDNYIIVETLEISGDFNDINLLSKFTNLKTLDLGGTKVSDIKPLSNLTNLQLLVLPKTLVSDINGLSKCTNLQLLWLSETKVSNIKPLANLTNLTGLILFSTDVSDISVLTKLTKLTYLFLSNTKVSDIRPLANLTNLQTIEIGGTQVKDVNALAGLVKLEWLNLSGTQVRDISPLANLKNLKSLNVASTPVSNEQIAELQKALPKVNITHSDKNASFPESVSSIISIENIDLTTLIGKENNSKPIRWSWIDPNDKKEVTWTAEEAFQDATNYLNGKQRRQHEALKMYQRVLDAKLSRQMELKTRLTMGDCMTIYYDSSLGEFEMCNEAFQWYKLLVRDFNDLGNHTDLMTAKIRLAHLYYCQPRYGIIELQKASALCLEVIRIPENDIIFDNELEVGYNFENIKNAKVPGGRSGPQGPSEQAKQHTQQRLLEMRQEVINRYRRLAIQALISGQHISSDFPPEAVVERLKLLKKERPDDQLYQQMLDDKIQEVSKTLTGNRLNF